MGSTLPPTPVFDPNVPIVSSAGGSTAAYNDPNSPESIMRKTAKTEAQANVDGKYDVNQPAREGFVGASGFCNQIFIAILLLIAAFFVFYKRVGAGGKVFLLGSILFLLLLLLQKKHAFRTC
jgi:hypothetical protein